MEDLAKVTIPPLPNIDRPKEMRIEFDGETSHQFETLLKTVILPLGYRLSKKEFKDGKTTMPFMRKGTL